MDEADRHQLEQHMREKRDFLNKAAPVRAAIRRFISEVGGEDLAAIVQIGFSPDLKEVGFNIWYRTDEELERDRASGRQEEIEGILRSAARECADADSAVAFHSHQFVQDRCGGNYFLYLK